MPGCANHFTPVCFLNEGQFKAGFVKKFKLKDDHFQRRERKRVSSDHYHVKRYALKRVTVNRADFDKVKKVLFYTTTETISRIP